MNAADMWREYLAYAGEDPESTDLCYQAWYFGASEQDAEELAGLVLKGDKRATASLKAEFVHDGEQLPQPGELSVITDYHGNARCVIRTTGVRILPFDEVPASFAAREGEGDKSLEFWRSAHWKFFSHTCEEIGLAPDTKMEVVCEEFELVWPV
jgi:uncharacterized protein YhfF